MAVAGELSVLIGASNAALMKSIAASEAALKTFSSAKFLAPAIVIGAGAAIFIGESIKMASAYQTAMSDIRVAANLTAPQTKAVGDAIASAAIGTTSSSTDMAKALAPIAGELARVTGGTLTASGAVLALKAAEDLAVATHGDLAPSLKSITDILLVYHMKAGDAAGVASLLAGGHEQLGVSTDVLSGQLQKLQPRLVGSGASLDTVLAIAREMEPVVGTGQRAVMKLGGVLQNFLVPSAGASKELATLGVHLTDAHGKFIGFGPAIDKINGALANTNPVERAAALHKIFGSNTAIATALLNGGSAGLAANQAALLGQGSAADQAAIKMADLSEQQKVLGASIDTAITAIGTAFLPAMNSLMSAILPVINGFAQWATDNPGTAATILAVAAGIGALAAAALLLGPLIAGISAVLGAIGAPILLIVGAIAALAAHFGLLGTGAQGFVDGILGTIGAMVPQVIATLQNLAGQFIAWIGPMIPQALAALAGFATQLIGWVVAQIPVFVAALLRWVDGFIGWIAPMIPKLLVALGKFGVAAIDWVLKEVPVLLGALGKLALQLVAWILPKIPDLLVNLGKFALALTVWIVGEIPKVAVAMAKMAIGFIGWVIDAIPGFVANLGTFLGSLLNWLGTVPGAIADAAFQIGAAIVTGIISGIGDLVGAIGKALGGARGDSASFDPITHMPKPGTTPKPAAPKPAAPTLPKAPGPGAGVVDHSGSLPPGKFALGGRVPGTGPMLAIVHGGEYIVPPGMAVANQSGTGGGLGNALDRLVAAFTITTKLMLDGQVLGEATDRTQYRQGTIYSEPSLSGASLR